MYTCARSYVYLQLTAYAGSIFAHTNSGATYQYELVELCPPWETLDQLITSFGLGETKKNSSKRSGIVDSLLTSGLFIGVASSIVSILSGCVVTILVDEGNKALNYFRDTMALSNYDNGKQYMPRCCVVLYCTVLCCAVLCCAGMLLKQLFF